MKKLFLCFVALIALLSSEVKAEPSTLTLSESNTLSINTYFFSDSVAPIMQQALMMDKDLPSSEPIYLVINSGGGSITAGLKLSQMLSGLNRPVHTLTMYSASMGFCTVQALGDRLILDSGTLMSHRAWGAFWGEFPNGNMESRYKYWVNRLYSQDKKVVKRNPKLKSIKHYRSLIANEYWCEGEQCVRHGFADRVVSARCDNSLKGTKDEWIKRTMNGYPIMIRLTYSKCPLQPYLLNWQVYFQGEPLWEKPTQSADAIYNPDAYNLFSTKEDAESVIQQSLKAINEYQSKEAKLVVE